MSRLFKTQAVADLRNIPVRMPDQLFGFPEQSFRDQIRSGSSGRFFDGPVEVVHVYGQLQSIILRRTHREPLAWRLDGELPFQQFREHSGDP